MVGSLSTGDPSDVQWSLWTLPNPVNTAFATSVVLLTGAFTVSAEDYPTRPVHIVVPTAAGSTQDITARLMQRYLEQSLKRPIVIDNRVGASTMIGTDAVAKATPDGYTLLIVPTTFTVNAALNSSMPYDPEKDFEPISLLVKNAQMLAVNDKVPARNVAEFVAYAKSRPGKLNYGTPGASSQPHLLIEMWSALAGIKMQHIPYRGGGPAANAVGAGETELTMLAYSVIRNHVEAGTVRVLASGGRERDPALPNVPTIAESGYPGYEGVQWLGMVTTKGTPKDIVQKVNAAVNEALRNPELVEKLAIQGSAPAGGTSEEFGALISKEIRNWKDAAQYAGVELK
jgi:tripartite-type tricarboxylate transporter receptor subunit TctC